MESQREMERLRKQAIVKNKKAKRFLKKMTKELSKARPDLKHVLHWQKRSARLLNHGVRLMEKRENIRLSRSSHKKKTVHFNLEKVSEKFVRKFGAASCVYRATMTKPIETDTVKVKDILKELDGLFTETIDQVYNVKCVPLVSNCHVFVLKA